MITSWGASGTESWPAAVKVRLMALPELWISSSRSMSYNAGVLLVEGRAWLVDPGVFPEETDAVKRFCEGRRAPVAGVILTHYHWDHILGPERLPDAPVIAQARALDVITEHGATIEKQVNQWLKDNDIRHDGGFRVPRPDRVFGDRLKLAGLELIAAPGHAPEALVVYEPAAGILWAGDMLSDIEVPFVMDSLADYIATLNELEELNTRVLVPGHGRATRDQHEAARRLDADLHYLLDLAERVGRAVETGASFEETLNLCADMKYPHPEFNRGPHRLNVGTAFLELGGDAGGRKVGWSRFE